MSHVIRRTNRSHLYSLAPLLSTVFFTFLINLWTFFSNLDYIASNERAIDEC
jgi:hypothetical protein